MQNLNFGMDLIISQFCTRIRKAGERIQPFSSKTKAKKELPIGKISKIIVLVPSLISPGAVGLALGHDADIVFSPAGKSGSSKEGHRAYLHPELTHFLYPASAQNAQKACWITPQSSG